MSFAIISANCRAPSRREYLEGFISPVKFRIQIGKCLGEKILVLQGNAKMSFCYQIFLQVSANTFTPAFWIILIFQHQCFCIIENQTI